MTTQTIERDLMQLERKFWDAIKSGDVAAVSKMTDTPSIIVGAQGVGEVDPAAMSKLMAQANWVLHSYSMEDTHVKMIGEDVAVVAYKVTEDITVDNERRTLVAHDASVWRRRDGNWICALHTESLAGDPFGRDKK